MLTEVQLEKQHKILWSKAWEGRLIHISNTTILTFSVPPQKNKTGVQLSDAVSHLEE